MNERIRQLLEQAKTESSQWLGSKPATTITYDELEKFAELIVRECVAKCEVVANMATITNTSTKATADSCAIMIKQHFGVEQ